MAGRLTLTAVVLGVGCTSTNDQRDQIDTRSTSEAITDGVDYAFESPQPGLSETLATTGQK